MIPGRSSRDRSQSPSMTATAAAVSPATRFPLPADALAAMAAQVLKAAKEGGATAAETEVSQAFGLSVTVRKDEVETIAYNRDKGIGVTVYVGTRRGHASTADFAPAAIEDTVAKALTIARYTAADDCAGSPTRYSSRAWTDLDPITPELSVEDAIALGRECEAAALAADPRLNNSDGATVSRHEAEFVYANSNGFSGGYPSSRHGLYCAVIGEDDGAMQRDDCYTTARLPSDLEAAARVGRIAGERTARRLGARQLATLDCPVIFEAPVATGLIGLVNAVSGGSLYRKSSFLVDSVGARYSRRRSRSARSRTSRAGRLRRRSMTRAWRRGRGTSFATASCAGTSSAAIPDASSA
jgi:PmbA protein